ncbi:hypothetical protein SAICODRAFT_30857 [Saitoella complicata NRRL Y-17804]|uniref:uncharacterized protein n=1 Tax=Saitoella complicata (strain BCRC 22490 / CBS 7301 / JCM 7358 / NBRC 10748 / NRRL Y-17804) TaxID=698492 RepID=UPI00086752E4|nr:uncharacterized protein SAICODRAFT_30857 [Saitoella complicata NRRL Y-17804]ODQ52041.1 hypothetical protein SAICODRAFT_30857 [Saitoella complicata NRRL Y-17804]
MTSPIKRKASQEVREYVKELGKVVQKEAGKKEEEVSATVSLDASPAREVDSKVSGKGKKGKSSAKQDEPEGSVPSKRKAENRDIEQPQTKKSSKEPELERYTRTRTKKTEEVIKGKEISRM